jgi:hypothetical protein
MYEFGIDERRGCSATSSELIGNDVLGMQYADT